MFVCLRERGREGEGGENLREFLQAAFHMTGEGCGRTCNAIEATPEPHISRPLWAGNQPTRLRGVQDGVHQSQTSLPIGPAQARHHPPLVISPPQSNRQRRLFSLRIKRANLTFWLLQTYLVENGFSKGRVVGIGRSERDRQTHAMGGVLRSHHIITTIN